MRTNKGGTSPLKLLAAVFAVAVMIAVPLCTVFDDGGETDAAVIPNPTYTVIIQPNGGVDSTNNGNDKVFTVERGHPISLPITMFTCNDMYLDYWEDTATGTQYEPGATVTINGDTTFKAIWVKDSSEYYWNFNVTLQEGDNYSQNWTSEGLSHVTDQSVDLQCSPSWLQVSMGNNGFTSADFTFTGSNAKPGIYHVSVRTSNVEPDNRAYWIITVESDDNMDNMFSVQYEYDGGTVQDSSQFEAAVTGAPLGTTITLPSADSITKHGAVLIGWQAVNLPNNPIYPAGGQFTFDSLTADPSTPIQFKAYWYTEDAAVVMNPYNAPVTVKEVQYGSTTKLSLDIALDPELSEGYTLTGWTDPSRPGVAIPIDTNYTINDVVIFGGYWVPDGSETCTVTFDSGVAEGDLSIEVVKGDSVYLPENLPKRSGYTFVGWSTDPDAAEPNITPGANHSYTPETDIELHAVWQLDNRPVDGIEITGTSVVYVGGASIRLEAVAYPVDASDRSIVWSVQDNLELVTYETGDIVSGGKVTGGWIEITGKQPGTVIVRAVAGDGAGTEAEKTITIIGGEQSYTHVLNFNDNGGVGGPGSRSVNTGTVSSYTFQIPQVEPTRVGYTFKGWAESADDGALPRYHWNPDTGLETSVTVTNELTLYAVWEQNAEPDPGEETVSVVYNAMGVVWPGTSSETVTEKYTLKDGSIEIILGAPPARIGYSFVGWSTDRDATSGSSDLRQAGERVQITESTTFYAVWKVNERTFIINYNLNGGNGAIETTTHTTPAYYADVPVTTDVPTKAGFTFLGWSTSPSATTAIYGHGEGLLGTIRMSTTTSEPPTPVVLYAVWGPVSYTYTMTLYPNGGVFPDGSGDPIVIKEVLGPEHSEYVFQIPMDDEHTPYRADGKVFNGWSTSATGTANYGPDNSQVNMNAQTRPSIDLYAVWVDEPTEDTVYLTIVIGIPDADDILLTGELAGGVCRFDLPTADDPRIPVVEGYTFLGYATEQGAETPTLGAGESYPVSEDTVIYAVWETDLVQITLCFNDNGGTNGPEDIVKDAPKGGYATFDIPMDYPEAPSGYTFVGWSTDPDAEQAEYMPGDTNLRLYADVELHAVYQPNQTMTSYELAFQDADGTELFDKQVWTDYTGTHDFTTPAEIPEDPTGADRPFLGWDRDPETEAPLYGVGVTVTLTADDPRVVLYAVWGEPTETETFLVSFVTGGGTDVPPQSVEAGGKVQRPVDPERDGWEFVGWFAEGSSEQFDFDTDTVDGDLRLIAQWTRVMEPVEPGDDDDDDPGQGGEVNEGGDGDGRSWTDYLWIVFVAGAGVMLAAAVVTKGPQFVLAGVVLALIAVASYLIL